MLHAKLLWGNKNILISFLYHSWKVRPVYSAFQCHGCWWSWNIRSQGISSHGIYLVLLDNSNIGTEIVNYSVEKNGKFPVNKIWPWFCYLLKNPILIHCVPVTPYGVIELDQTHPYKFWDENTHPFPNFNGGTVEVWEWINDFITYLTGHVITYPCWE